MNIFNNIKTSDRPSNKGRRVEQENEPESWLAAFKGCMLAIVLFVGAMALICGLGNAINSSEIGNDILLIIGLLFVIGLIGFYLGVPAFLVVWGFLSRGEGNRHLKIIVSLIIALLVVGLILYTCGSLGNGSELYEPGKLRPDKF